MSALPLTLSSKSGSLHLRILAFYSLAATALVVFAWRINARARPALRVGDYVLSTRDIEQRDHVARVANPQVTTNVGRAQLKHAYIYAQILKDHGYALSEEAVLQEQERIILTTQRPDILQRIQGVFHGDMAAFRRVYVLPELAERSIYFEFFLHDPLLQKESREKVEAFLRDAERSGFEKAANVLGQKATTFHLTRVRRELSSDDGGAVLSPEGAQRLLDQVAHSREGAILSIPIDNGETWLAARYVSQGRDAEKTITVQCLTFPKADFGPWAEHEADSVPVVDITQ